MNDSLPSTHNSPTPAHGPAPDVGTSEHSTSELRRRRLEELTRQALNEPSALAASLGSLIPDVLRVSQLLAAPLEPALGAGSVELSPALQSRVEMFLRSVRLTERLALTQQQLARGAADRRKPR